MFARLYIEEEIPLRHVERLKLIFKHLHGAVDIGQPNCSMLNLLNAHPTQAS